MKRYSTYQRHRFQRNQIKYFVFATTVCLFVNLIPLSLSSPLNKPMQQGGWEQIESGVTQDLNSVFFICLNRGTVVGDEGIILRTGEGGGNWTPQVSGVLDNLYDVSYYGYTKILAVGSSGTIIYTTNTGMNWTILQTGMMGSYYSCQMVNETVGVAVGVNAIFQPFFTRTNDGWATWDSTSFYIEHESVFYEGRLTDVHFLNTTTGFATAIVDIPTGGAIVRTMNGGLSWETMFFSNDALFSIDFTLEGNGYAVGDNGVVIKTSDGGETWQALNSGVNTALQGVDFSSETTGTIVGDNGIILRTENEGQNWAQQSSGTSLNLLGLYCVTDMFAVVSGEQGIILRTTTGGYPEDTTPPETTCTLSGTMEGGIYISNVQITFTVTDDQSGVAATMYKLDEEPWTTYESPTPLIVGEDGQHKVRYYSIDNAGNIEPEKTTNFTIQHPPNLVITISGGFGIKVHVKNLGNTTMANESWTLLLDGGFLLFGKQKTGTSTIEAGEEITLSSPVFGVGKPTITFAIGQSHQTVQGSVFLFFVRI